MKAREETKVSTLRMLKSAIQNAEVAGDEAVELAVGGGRLVVDRLSGEDKCLAPVLVREGRGAGVVI
ncbi:MAG: hypothetical protein EBZ00_02610 [Actinobacteria bacterium]|nr:hypothetical protein [Actinomycetota bacterium]